MRPWQKTWDYRLYRPVCS